MVSGLFGSDDHDVVGETWKTNDSCQNISVASSAVWNANFSFHEWCVDDSCHEYVRDFTIAWIAHHFGIIGHYMSCNHVRWQSELTIMLNDVRPVR